MNVLNQLFTLAQQAEPLKPSFWFPEPNSTFAEQVDGLYDFILIWCVIFFVPMMGLMFYFMIRYRRRPGVDAVKTATHNTPLELAWSIIPGILLVVIFARGFWGYADMRQAPADADEVDVYAKMWNWSFKYKNGYIDDQLHVVAGKPVKLTMRSDDVIHSLFVPAARAKQDVVPGRYSMLWFQPLEPGIYHVFCTEYCGTKHSDMITKMVVHPQEGEYTAKTIVSKEGDKVEDVVLTTFDAWLEYASDIRNVYIGPDGKFSPVMAGAALYEKRGCNQCHSIDGTKKVGPTFKGSFGTQIPIQGGTKVAMDENYIRESVLYPNAKIHEGYPAKMPSFLGQLKDIEIDALIAFIKDLKSE